MLSFLDNCDWNSYKSLTGAILDQVDICGVHCICPQGSHINYNIKSLCRRAHVNKLWCFNPFWLLFDKEMFLISDNIFL